MPLFCIKVKSLNSKGEVIYYLRDEERIEAESEEKCQELIDKAGLTETHKIDGEFIEEEDFDTDGILDVINVKKELENNFKHIRVFVSTDIVDRIESQEDIGMYIYAFCIKYGLSWYNVTQLPRLMNLYFGAKEALVLSYPKPIIDMSPGSIDTTGDKLGINGSLININLNVNVPIGKRIIWGDLDLIIREKGRNTDISYEYNVEYVTDSKYKYLNRNFFAPGQEVLVI